MKPLRIGTRGSALALWQANHLRDALAKSFGIESEIVVVKTSGDRLPLRRSNRSEFAASSPKNLKTRSLTTAPISQCTA